MHKFQYGTFKVERMEYYLYIIIYKLNSYTGEES